MNKTTNYKTYGLILAGGSGSRLWPMSREMFPKQLLKLYNNSEKTLFQNTVHVLSDVIEPKNLFTITNIKHENDLSIQYSEILEYTTKEAKNNFIIEPIGRNTAPAIVAASLYLIKNFEAKAEEAIVIVSPADHFIANKLKYANLLEKGIELAKQNFIVTLGITPDKPETAYGYIKVDTKNPSNNGFLMVDKFLEKPSIEKAKEFIEDGNYYWNSGLFIFKVSTLLKEMEKYTPDLLNHAEKINYKNNHFEYEEYKDFPNISIDYAVMEKTQNIVVLPTDVGWSDLGSWDSVHDNSQKDNNQNSITGNVISLDCKNSLIHGSENLIAAIGLENVVIVSSEDATLICKKDNTQDVKTIFNLLKEKKDNTYKVHKTQLRGWGYHTLLKEEEKFKIRQLCIKPNGKTSMQMHYHKNKNLTIVDGTAKLIVDEDEIFLAPGESIHIPAATKHRLINPGKIDLKIIETVTGNYIGDDDIVRFPIN